MWKFSNVSGYVACTDLRITYRVHNRLKTVGHGDKCNVVEFGAKGLLDKTICLVIYREQSVNNLW